MSIGSTILTGMFRLQPGSMSTTETLDITVMSTDGTRLSTDLFQPEAKGDYPTLLMRVPYGRGGFLTVAQHYAEHGYNAILQACRGTGLSEGEFDPLRNEREDGLATLEWIKQQPWYDGRIGVTGPSYLGYTQWAIADALPEHSAMSTKQCSSDFESVVFPGGAFSLQLWLSWLQIIQGLRSTSMGFSLKMMTGDIERRTARAAAQLPLMNADITLTGDQVPFWRRWMDEAIDNPAFWEPLSHTKRIGKDTPPDHFVSGWYDFMLDQLLGDYQRLVAEGHTPYLTIGTWHHIDRDVQGEAIRQTLDWMDAKLKNKTENLRKKPVRIHISGGLGWREFDQFPPEGGTVQSLYLRPDGALGATSAPSKNASTKYTYDPANPTPSVGGAIFAFSGAGAQENKKLEARDDVLTFTSAPLEEPMTVVGHTKARIHIRSKTEWTDLFVRLCDVSPKGKSTNICDGFLRLTPEKFKDAPDGIAAIELNLHATAHHFKKGHALRVQVSSGAHPRFARNLGTPERISTATKIVVQHQEIFHDAAHQSVITLPIFGG